MLIEIYPLWLRQKCSQMRCCSQVWYYQIFAPKVIATGYQMKCTVTLNNKQIINNRFLWVWTLLELFGITKLHNGFGPTASRIIRRLTVIDFLFTFTEPCTIVTLWFKSPTLLFFVIAVSFLCHLHYMYLEYIVLFVSDATFPGLTYFMIVCVVIAPHSDSLSRRVLADGFHHLWLLAIHQSCVTCALYYHADGGFVLKRIRSLPTVKDKRYVCWQCQSCVHYKRPTQQGAQKSSVWKDIYAKVMSPFIQHIFLLCSLANPGCSVTLVAVVFLLKWVWLFSDIWMQKL